jgi:hypothetical protein
MTLFGRPSLMQIKFIAADPNVVNMRGAVGECPIHMLFLYGTDAHLEIARDLITRFPEIVIQIYNKPVSVHSFLQCFTRMI